MALSSASPPSSFKPDQKLKVSAYDADCYDWRRGMIIDYDRPTGAQPAHLSMLVPEEAVMQGILKRPVRQIAIVGLPVLIFAVSLIWPERSEAQNMCSKICTNRCVTHIRGMSSCLNSCMPRCQAKVASKRRL
jgi:hypothetical protein